MSTGTLAPVDPQVQARPSAPPPRTSRGRRLLRFAGLPGLLVLVLVAVLLYVRTAQLDDIEARLLDTHRLVTATLRHLQLVVVSSVVVVALAVPLGVLATRPRARRIAPVIIGIGNIAQGLPSLGVLVLLAVTVGIGFRPVIVALVVYAFLPILRNTIIGLQQVDAFVVESARGMGMPSGAVLRRIELPLAVPVILAGVRTAAVINVGSATIAALINAGGLGEIIYQGITLNRTTVIVVGSILTAVLALALDFVGGIAEEFLRPRGL